ncbi:Mg2+ and Co2+ transporter [Motilimonas pumila]|uniref:Mg2+ and Co2+ transporter n=2 Tax=Motilimonas pumila TaxID=2303987 RepID=A0A418Y9W4_9GAMM|nr:Mg2+ and Co2+ transporter [Motilimonas pumila]
MAEAFTVHHKELADDYWTTTSVLKHKLLDAEWFIGLLTMMTVTTLGLVVWGYWKLHALPKKHAAHTGQPKLVFWLCMLGFFYNNLWIAAVLIVVTDWSKISQWLKRGQTA